MILEFPVSLQASGCPRPFRYTVSPQGRVHVFEPTPLQKVPDKLDMRATMLGAIHAGALSRIPQSEMGKTLFEV